MEELVMVIMMNRGNRQETERRIINPIARITTGWTFVAFVVFVVAPSVAWSEEQTIVASTKAPTTQVIPTTDSLPSATRHVLTFESGEVVTTTKAPKTLKLIIACRYNP